MQIAPLAQNPIASHCVNNAGSFPALNDVLARLCHDLRTPLAGIRAYIEMLMDGEAPDAATRSEFYRVIASEACRLNHLIDSLKPPLIPVPLEDGKAISISSESNQISPKPPPAALDTTMAANMTREQPILIADDESHIRSVVSLKLRNAGYRVISASDGQEALEMAAQANPCLLITDYHMPLLSGVELCQRLRAQNATIPAILLTARGYDLEPQDTRQNGILRMLSKPFSPRQLLATVEDLLTHGMAA